MGILRVTSFCLAATCTTPALRAAEAAPTPAPREAAPTVMNPFGVLAEQFELQAYIVEDKGVRYLDKMLVGPVTKGSLAARAGLKEGMNIVSIYGVPVAGRIEREFVRDYIAHHDPAKVTLVISRLFGGPRTIEIVWPAAKAAPVAAEPVK